MRAAIKRRRGFDGRRVLAAALLLGGLAASPARAQFSFFGPSEASPQDIYDTIGEHGFRLVGPLYRNGRVYMADVIDRRQRRERLVIAAENGQIVQRFLVDINERPDRRAPAAAPPRDDSFFSHLTRGWDDEPPPRPPLGLDGPGEPAPAPAPRRREPRVVTRTEGTVPLPGAVTTSPLPSAPARPDDAARKPDTASAPAATAPAATPSAPKKGTSVSTDPLRIPGTRPTEPAASVASKAQSPAPTPPAPAAAPPKPAAPAADVPVAPLD